MIIVVRAEVRINNIQNIDLSFIIYFLKVSLSKAGMSSGNDIQHFKIVNSYKTEVFRITLKIQIDSSVVENVYLFLGGGVCSQN